MKRILALAVCLWASGLGVASAQTLEVIPNQVMVDESAAIRATGLHPNQRVSMGREENLGGSAKGDAQSSLDAIPKVLEFLRQSLQGGPSQP